MHICRVDYRRWDRASKALRCTRPRRIYNEKEIEERDAQISSEASIRSVWARFGASPFRFEYAFFGQQPLVHAREERK